MSEKGRKEEERQGNSQMKLIKDGENGERGEGDEMGPTNLRTRDLLKGAGTSHNVEKKRWCT